MVLYCQSEWSSNCWRFRCCSSNYLQYVDGSQDNNWGAAISSVKAIQKSHQSHWLNGHPAKMLPKKTFMQTGVQSFPQANLNDTLEFSTRATLAFKITREQTVLQALHIDNNLTIDPPTVIQCVTEQLMESRPESSSYTLSFLKDRGVQPGEAVNCNNRGVTRRRQNQLLMETVSPKTLIIMPHYKLS